MIKNTYQSNIKSNDNNILLISILSVILIIGMFSALFITSNNLKSDIIKEKNTLLYPINNNIEDLNNIVYKIVNNNKFIYCPFKEGLDDDKDDIFNSCDNCPIHYNPDQLDNDFDGIGNICDLNPNKKPSNDAISKISCNSNSDCGSNGFIGNTFCSNNNVVQLYTSYICMNPGKSNSLCISDNEQRTIQNCNLGCLNGQCISQPPVTQCVPSTEICDSRDNDCDNLIDEDNVCQPPPQPTTPQCDDGVDNDNDNLIDYPADSGCSNRLDNDEFNAPISTKPQCDDGVDNDNDGRIDFPADPQCSNRIDNSE